MTLLNRGTTKTYIVTNDSTSPPPPVAVNAFFFSFSSSIPCYNCRTLQVYFSRGRQACKMMSSRLRFRSCLWVGEHQFSKKFCDPPLPFPSCIVASIGKLSTLIFSHIVLRTFFHPLAQVELFPFTPEGPSQQHACGSTRIPVNSQSAGYRSHMSTVEFRLNIGLTIQVGAFDISPA